MPFYNDLRPEADFLRRDYARVFPGLTDAERIRCIDGLLRLKAALAAEVPARRTEANLLLASWNLKEFGHTGQRLPEAYFHISEILSAFDLIAVQEVKSTLRDLDLVMRLLGADWRYMVTDITDGRDGNSERSAYVFNTRRVRLSGLAGEVALWDAITDDSPLGIRQLKRSPYVTGFIAGWKRFALMNLHLHPGDAATDRAFRQEEIRLLLRAIAAKDRDLSENLVLLGDMNLYQQQDGPALALLAAAGFRESAALAGKDTNVTQSEAYDRMFFRENAFFHIARGPGEAEAGGVFDMFAHVFRAEDALLWRTEMAADRDTEEKRAAMLTDDAACRRYFRDYWRKNQMSDHFPIWVELVTDDSAAFLRDKRAALGAPA